MKKWDFLSELQKQYGLELTEAADQAILTDPKTGAHVDVFEEAYFSKDSGEPAYVDYIVCFSTQHRHLRI